MNRSSLKSCFAAISASIAAFAIVWAAPLLALASPEAHGEAGGHGAEHGAEHGAHVGNQGIKWIGDGFLGGPGEDGRTGFLIILINFAALLLVLNKLLFSNLRKANAEKSDAIRLELERATEARNTAEELVKEYETKLSALEVEIGEIRSTAKAQAEAEHARIIAEAHEQAKKIKIAAERAAEREAARQRTQIENEIVDQALARAEEAIRKSFGGSDQRRLVDAWITEVSSAQINQAGGPN